MALAPAVLPPTLIEARTLDREHYGTRPASAGDRLSQLASCAELDPLVMSSALGSGPLDRGSVFLGTGLVTRSELGIGLPLDVLGMVVLADDVRRLLSLDRVVHLIADRHAEFNTFADPLEVARLTATAVEDLRIVIRALGISGYTIVKGSALKDDGLHARLLESGPVMCQNYLRREVADVEWARQAFDARVKIGWAMSRDPEGKGWDERRFDAAHRRSFGDSLHYIYAVPGRTDQRDRPRVSPYVLLPDDKRPALRPGVGKPISVPSSKGMRRHLDRLAARLELRLGPPDTSELSGRLTRIRNLLFAEAGKEPAREPSQ